MKADVGADENLPTSTPQQQQQPQSGSLCETNMLNTPDNGQPIVRNTLQLLNLNVCLTRLNVDCDLTKSAGIAVEFCFRK